MKKRVVLVPSLMRLLPLSGILLVASFLLPWLNIPADNLTFTGFGALQILKSKPLLILAALSGMMGLVALFVKKKNYVIFTALLQVATLVFGVACLLSAKRNVDDVMAGSFMMSDLGAGLWVFLALAFISLFITLKAMREPIEYIVLTLMASVWLLPIIWLILTALRQEPGAYTPYILPKNYTFDNFRRLFTETQLFNFPRWYMNTLVVAIFSCIITTVLVLMVSYTFSRLRFPSRKALMNITLILGMFPGFMSMIAIYHILKAIGLAKSLVSLVIVYSSGAALSYFVPKGFFDTIPRSLDEAATIDGASRNTVFWKIILPSSQPIVIYTAITAFIAPWVDFIFVSVIMKDDYQNYTVALGLFKMLEREHIYEYFTRFCAGAVLVAIPITLLFIKIQKFYVEGVTGGAVKG
jgi:arabinogalactan oligomer/maltooligosaccharide transport system permease protein